jgi:hypothetical protein
MRTGLIVTLLAVTALAGREERYLKLGQEQLQRLDQARANAAKKKKVVPNATKLRLLRKAAYYLRRAGDKGKPHLVRTLNLETGV